MRNAYVYVMRIRTIARRTITINNPVNPATEKDMRYKFHKVITL